LEAGPFYATSHRLQIFVPFSEIERENIAPQSGALNITACVDDFDPVDAQGVSNYVDGLEPGANRALHADGSASNNCSGPITVHISSRGGFNHRMLSTANDLGYGAYLPLVSRYHSGDGMAEPTVPFVHNHHVFNNGSVDLSNSQTCIAIDNSTQKLVDRGRTGGTPGTYAYVASSSGGSASDWQVEYASATYTTVDPLDSNGDGAFDFDPQTGRYKGDWSQMQSMRCDDAALTWSTDPNVIGIDDVNMIRVVAVDPTVTQLVGGQTLRMVVPVEARDTFYGGPHAGTAMPVGVVMAGFSSWRTDERYPDWLQSSYKPSPENSSGSGDRMTFTRVFVDLSKYTVSPEAPAGSVSTLDWTGWVLPITLK